MNSTITCPHCKASLAAPKTGMQPGVCPRCGQMIAAESLEENREPPPPSNWWESLVSMLVSIVVHAALVLVLALWPYGGSGIAGSGENVLIGEMPGETLSEQQDEELSSHPVDETPPTALADEQLEEIEPMGAAPAEAVDSTLAATAPSASGSSTGGGSGLEFDVSLPGSGGSGGNWGDMLQTLRRNGLDIVIVFDSTGSMGGEISQVKRQIQRIGTTLLKLVPKTRISLCTYRDDGDVYEVQGIPLTDDINELSNFLDDVDAEGGGDTPEAVHQGMGWAMDKNEFRPRARKVMLIFGDAPPHEEYLQRCLQIAADFRRANQGIVSTVTCRGGTRLREFVMIADSGGGEAFRTSDERQIMTQLMVLVFGSKHKEKVLEAFRLIED